MKSINLAKLSLGVVLIAGASCFVNAQEEIVLEPVEDFSQIDADGNGQLTEAEVIESKSVLLKEAFEEIDSNDDTEISKDELTQYLVNN